MPQFFLNKRLIILLVSIIILVALIGFSLREREEINLAGAICQRYCRLGSNPCSKPAHYVAGFFENLQDLQNTYEENKELKSKLNELASLKAQYRA